MRVASAVAALLLTACATAPRMQPPSLCTSNAALAGTWRSYRLSALGPAWMTITLRCDCTARVATQLLYTRVTEETTYRVEGNALVFARRSGDTRWPFTSSGEALSIEEAPGERHEYRLVARERCP